MVCSVCQQKLGKCGNGACGEVLRDRLYCFGGVHFCSRSCWKVWFLSGEEEKLTLAKGVEQVRKSKPIEAIGKAPKEKGVTMYALKCVNCGKQPEVAQRIITGECMESGEWVCSDSCYTAFVKKRVQEGIRG